MKMLAAILLSVPLAIGAQDAAIPATPPGRQLTAWLTAFKSANRETLRRFYDTNAPALSDRVDPILGLAERVGSFDYRKTEASSVTSLTALMQEHSSDQIARVVIEVDDAPPHHITRLDLAAIPRPPDLALPRMSDAELSGVLRAKLDELAAADMFSGAVIVAKHGVPIYSGAVGWADREKRIPNSVDTRFRIGSMNKMFTAVAVLQLVQQGKIDLNAPMGRYLTDYPNKDVAARVTIHHLLTHTGGTGDIFGPEFAEHRLELRAVPDFVKLFGPRGLQFDPGSQFSYSNYGFVLLGAVIEKVSGVSYYDYVRDHVYQPAGMIATGSEPETEIVPGRSVGYMRSSGALRPNTETLPWRGMPAGGGYSTVGDLLRFANALNNHTLLNPQLTKLLTTGKVSAGPGEMYAYGFFERTADGARRFGHSGGAPGMNGDLAIFPQSGYVVAVLSNLSPPAANSVSDFIVNRLALLP
jgi:D-alanyl-D-alanine carboxypeptidase